MLWGSLCGLLGTLMFVMSIVWWFTGPRPDINWGKSIVLGTAALFIEFGLPFILKDMSQRTVEFVQGVLFCVLGVFSLIEYYTYSRHIRRRIWKCTFMLMAAMTMWILAGLIVAGMSFVGVREMLMARRDVCAGNGCPTAAAGRATQSPAGRLARCRASSPVSHANVPRRSSDAGKRPRQQPRIENENTPPRQPTQSKANPSPQNADRPAPEQQQQPPQKRGVNEARLRRFMPTPAEEVPDVWTVQPDPLVEKIRVPPDLLIHFPGYTGPSPTTLYPALPSRFVAIGSLRDYDNGLTVWDCESIRQVGRISGRQISPSSYFALSPDGRYFAGKDNRAGRPITISSFLTGGTVVNIPVPAGSLRPFVMQFAGPKCLVTIFIPDNSDENHGLVQAWSLPEGKLLAGYQVAVDRYSSCPPVLSATGKYLAFAEKHLAIYEATSGKLLGARPFPYHQGDQFWICRGAAFSPDGTELAAFFSVSGPRQSLHTVVWNLSDGRVIVHRISSGDWLSGYYHNFSRNAPRVQWMEGLSGWLLAGTIAVDRKTGKPSWRFSSERDCPNSLVDGRHLLAVASTGLSWGLIACEVSPAKRPDFRNHPAVNFRPGFLDGYKYKWYLRVEVVEYRGEGDIVSAARRALDGVPRIDVDKMELDNINNVLYVGFNNDKWCDRMQAKKALEKGGFKIGRTDYQLQ